MQLTHFIEAHDSYLAAWDDAMRTGDASFVERFLAADYHGWFAPAAQQATPYDREEGIDGMRPSVAALAGATMRADHRRLTARSDDDVVATYDKRITRGDEAVAAALIVEAWSHTDHGWLLHRELTEHGIAAF